MNFLRKTTTFITTLKPRVIIISNLGHDVEIIFQHVDEEQSF
jgi:hypothetical protein